MITLYHTTHKASAYAIIADGFRDATGTYMTTEEHAGVWLANQPLDINEGADGDTLLAVDFDDLAPLAEYEWVEDGKPYREWLVPATLINSIGQTRIWGLLDDWPSKLTTCIQEAIASLSKSGNRVTASSVAEAVMSLIDPNRVSPPSLRAAALEGYRGLAQLHLDALVRAGQLSRVGGEEGTHEATGTKSRAGDEGLPPLTVT